LETFVDTDWSSFLSREDLLGGLPARRASTLLFAIESRTAQLVARSRKAMATYLTERTAEQQEQAFFEALSEGRDLPVQVAIQDLERYAREWAPLVSDDTGVRASLARLIAEKYGLPRGRLRHISAALGLDEPAVIARYEQLHGTHIDSLYPDRIPLRERFRWFRHAVATRLENLPPFWTAFALTLTETVGAGILALPITFAAIGPIAGVIAIVVLGIVNLVTIAAMAEAVARNGNVRYGRAYFGRLVRDYLGRAGTIVLSPALISLNAVVLLAYFIGMATVLTDAFGVRPEIWSALLFVTVLFFIRRESLDATVASALLVGATTISLILMMSVISLPHVSGENLRHAEIPFRNGVSWDSSVLELIFGVVLLAFFGHTSTANCAAVVLAREPTGRSLIKGSVAALAAAMLLYCLWVVAVGGAVSPSTLAAETGTSLGPLADQVGKGVTILGVTFAVLAMGMASIHVSLGLSNQVKEWFPDSTGPARTVISALRTREGRMLAGMIPVAIIFLFTEWLFFANSESFAALLGFIGVLTAPIVAGVFSMVMLASARRKGDCAVGAAWRFLDHPVVTVATCALFVASVVVHWLLIWDDPGRRAAGVIVTVVLIWFLIAIRTTAFIPRAVIEMRLGSVRGSRPVLNLVAPSSHGAPTVEWTPNGAADQIGGAVVQIDPIPVRELKVWTHRLTPEGISEGVGASLNVSQGQAGPGVDGAKGSSVTTEYPMPDGQVVVPFDGATARLSITLAGGKA
jgi:amino acid permease